MPRAVRFLKVKNLGSNSRPANAGKSLINIPSKN